MLAQWFVRSPHMIVRSWVRMPPSERWKNNFKSRKVVEQIFGKNNSDFFKMAINPQPLSRLFSSFQTIITIFTTNICKKCPSSIRWWGLNPRSSEHKYPPITTRLTIQIFPSNLIHNSPPPYSRTRALLQATAASTTTTGKIQHKKSAFKKGPERAGA